MTLDQKTRRFAHSLFKLSLEDGSVSASNVSGILAWVDREKPRQATGLLREFLRLVTTEINRSVARVAHAGSLSPDALQRIGKVFSQRYGRAIEPIATSDPDLIAGLRIRIGCDVYENSVASQLAALASKSI